MHQGVLLALFAYAVFAWGDGIIKSLAGRANVFEIAFYAAIFTGCFLFFAKPADERWRDFWRTSRPFAVHGRAIGGLLATLFVVYAFTTIPLAETYAILFLAPLVVTVMSVIFLREQVGPWRWLAVVAGFAGVLLVVRPGFRELQAGHVAALVGAVLAAGTMVLLRTLAGNEKRTTVFGALLAYGIVGNGVLVLATADGLPDWDTLAALVVIGLFAAIGHATMFKAAAMAPANLIAPTHYSQILWAVAIGAAFFDEHPDLVAFIGLAVIVAAGLLTLMRERVRLGTVRWNPFARSRL
ncbi:MAG: DMT family transporter [Rhizobiaceae bacterium]|nr:DMT family transporter [Rhizobiaceae bacterium]